jgi:hypothetical protein
MKHSHRLLIALLALAAALALFFWPRGTAAAPLAHSAVNEHEPAATDSFEQRCEALTAPVIQVTAAPPSYVLKTDLSTRILSTRTGDASGNHSVMGMTASRTLAEISLVGPSLIDPAGARECIAPRIDVILRFEPLDVYIAREFARHSCAYREVLKHEMQHVKVYAEGMARIERMVHGELTLRYGGKPHYAKAGQGLDSLQEELNGWLSPMLREQLAQVELLQARLDSIEATDILSHACRGEVAMMMGSSF